MARTVFTLKRKKDTEELHLFEGERTDVAKCTSNSNSICNKMSKVDSEGNIFSCEEEDSARKKCADLGRKACGVCVSHLYTTYR